MTKSKHGRIIIAHGLFMSNNVMTPMAKRLLELGWDARCIDYCSTNISEDEVFTKISENLPEDKDIPVNFIGHSLGGLMIRHFFNVCNPTFPGRIVTMGTPHQTADIGKLLQELGVEKIIGNSANYGIIEKLYPDTWTHKNEIGNIAGNLRLGIQLVNPRTAKITNDGTVLEPETHLLGQKDHITLNVSHTTMVYAKKTVMQANHFLLNGKFDRS